ncbi:hypothetical protein [Metasolibacillus sp.]|uniref:hypothetical protein n=1 Tax=Metasolibacillus sp. TaxID=2703680 RepID=UPI0025F0F839|nr:hypothetical protein [Metasolibacillus sp.]MCT6922822.1 hypothetical protein [Metasolibacillus sp.]MCT6938839.1 hypothetical protein [Metasolibacillus sp.]
MKNKLNRGLENFVYKVFLSLLAVSAILFFTSKWWLYDDDPINQTPFNQDVAGLDQTTLVLKKWHYNPEKNLMEIMLETKHTGTDNVQPTFAFAAKASQTLDPYPVKIVYQKENQFVLHVEQVQADYQLVGVFIKEFRNPKILESATRDQLLAEGKVVSDEAISQNMPKPKEKVIVGDYRKVEVDTSLKEKTPAGYQEEFVLLEIEQLDKQVQSIKQKQLPLQDEIIASINHEIDQLESEMIYKTDEEKLEVQQQIAKKKSAIEDVHEKQKQYEQRVQALQQKREKLLEKIEKIRNEK